MTPGRLLPLLLATLPALTLAADELPLPEGLPPQVRSLFEREIPALPAKDWAVEGRVKGKVEAAAPPTVTPGKEMDEVTIPIGTGLAVSCTLARERMDAGGWLAGVLAEVGKGVKLAAVRPVELQVVEGSPLLFVDALYVLERKEGNQVGMLKLALHAHDAHMFLCVHDEPGYRTSFRRIAHGFAAAMTGGEDERDGARYAEIAELRIGAIPVGFAETIHWDRQGGGTIARNTSAMVLPRTAAELATVDSFQQEASDAKDLILEGIYVESANGELSHKLKLARRPDGKGYTVEGSKSGKALKGTFTVKDGLASDLWFARRLAASAKPVDVLKHDAYSTSQDPTRATSTTARRVKGSARQVEISTGDLSYTAELDEDGQQIRAELPIGPIRMVVEQRWVRGTP